MPKFYFDVAGNGFGSGDEDPVDLTDAECARQFAEGLAKMLQGHDNEPVNVIIRDESGTVVNQVFKDHN